MNLRKSIGMSLIKNGVSRAEMSEKTGHSLACISRWINGGVITSYNLIILSDFFEVPLSEFIKIGEDDD